MLLCSNLYLLGSKYPSAHKDDGTEEQQSDQVGTAMKPFITLATSQSGCGVAIAPIGIATIHSTQ